MTKVIGLLTCKDEEDILPLMLKENDWLDGIIAIDNDSSDNTYDILSKCDKVLELNVSKERFSDKYFVSQMISAANKYNADWYVILDADEIYERIIRKEIDSASNKYNVVTVTMKYILGFNKERVHRIRFDFPRIFRNLGLDDFNYSVMGNLHKSKIPIAKENRICCHSDVICWHYQIRSREQGLRKYERWTRLDAGLAEQPIGYEHIKELALKV